MKVASGSLLVRRETMDTPMGKVQTVVLKPETKYQGVLQKRGDSFIWLTDDHRRILVRLEAKVKIGTVIAALKKAEAGLSPEAVAATEAAQAEAAALGKSLSSEGPAPGPAPSP